VLKEARTLSSNGYQVRILNTVFSPELLKVDAGLIREYPMIQVHHVSDLTRHNLGALIDRFLFLAGRLLVKYLKIDNALALGYAPYRYVKSAKTFTANLYICHQELATFVGTKLLKAKRKVAFDFEDWYSEDLSPDARRQRPVNLLTRCENFALKHGTFCTTTSAVLALRLAEAYASPEPTMIYNVFPKQVTLERKKKLSEPLKLFWFSQTIGPGRGLEKFLTHLQLIPLSIEVHLLGHITDEYRALLIRQIPAQHSIHFRRSVAEPDLAQVIAEFDIGLALEQNEPASRDLTITNKLFQYLQAGLPIIATETSGQKEIYDQFAFGFMIPLEASRDDIKALQLWLADPAAIEKARKIAAKAASRYSWENESKKLLNLVNHAVCPKS
jgi:glycosyltransferase involved in cell wall biosynthesis